MNKLKERLKKYFEKSSKWKIAGDFIFYLFILLMIIPATRRPLSTALIKATMRKPKVISEAAAPKLQTEDYNMSFMDYEGNNVILDDLKGEVILLNFWATWCPPCRAEMPSIQALYNDYGEKIKMLLVSSEDPTTVQQFLDQYEYSLPVYSQRSSSTPTFNVSSIPTTFLIAKNGRIVTSKTGAANWNSQKFRLELDSLINE